MTKLLVATGNYLKSVEIINLDPEKPKLVCDDLPDLPLGLEGATGNLFEDEIPIICGGYNSGMRPSINDVRKQGEGIKYFVTEMYNLSNEMRDNRGGIGLRRSGIVQNYGTSLIS